LSKIGLELWYSVAQKCELCVIAFFIFIYLFFFGDSNWRQAKPRISLLAEEAKVNTFAQGVLL